jgi:hypothetical protein
MGPVPKPGKSSVDARRPQSHAPSAITRPHSLAHSAAAMYPEPKCSRSSRPMESGGEFCFCSFFLSECAVPVGEACTTFPGNSPGAKRIRLAQTLTTRPELKRDHRRRTKRNCSLEKRNCAWPGGQGRHRRCAIENKFRRVGNERIRARLRVNARFGGSDPGRTGDSSNPETLLDPQPWRRYVGKRVCVRKIEARKLVTEGPERNRKSQPQKTKRSPRRAAAAQNPHALHAFSR